MLGKDNISLRMPGPVSGCFMGWLVSYKWTINSQQPGYIVQHMIHWGYKPYHIQSENQGTKGSQKVKYMSPESYKRCRLLK